MVDDDAPPEQPGSDEGPTLEDPPSDPRVIAMLAALFGQDWAKRGDVKFEDAPMESWVYAAETMLAAADRVDPIRAAIRGLMQEASSDRDDGSMPKSR